VPLDEKRQEQNIFFYFVDFGQGHFMLWREYLPSAPFFIRGATRKKKRFFKPLEKIKWENRDLFDNKGQLHQILKSKGGY
jgi:hypothetical protein